MDREYDIILFGASSFVGKTTARYLHDNHPELQVALAGRNEDKLKKLDLGLDIIVANAMDGEEMDEMAKQARVIISTVGPYARYGDKVVEACAVNGTHYVDLCGEALFARRSIDKWHGLAQETGARIVHACGFDSVPSDMGMFYLHEKAGVPLEKVTMAVEHLDGGFSGGTIDSVRELREDAQRMPNGQELLRHPHTLSPDIASEPDLGEEPDLVVDNDELVGQWVGPFFMASFNTRIVRRSNSLLDHAYGSRLRYREASVAGGRLKAHLGRILTMAAFAAIMTPILRKPLSLFIPEPGDGPKDIDKGGFTIAHYGLGEDGSKHVTRVSADGDPGYKVTAMMLAEAAVTLATSPEGLPERAGVLTPATALGKPYLEALQSKGMRFSVES